ncbi:NUDIX domain-containing protein [Glycomyces harbinensis]|uniref:8-oxo-dGTP pyrophosphatase MutT, NUDIX family n=1 Tax=Glycomyces harbinensis TaxID=58114 RepID=A0A1G6W5I1_9ACTN|nr:NUDIX domain-containing protein [Glycomyces harbinensis]SDD61132.1 8-oxo-dGTP pyrophosphatase MutT, NUDIX family [Glycomyces harbinensis]
MTDIEAETGAVLRIAARILLLDQHDTVLHIGGNPCMDGVVRWFTPGGGVDPGETIADAASRELLEETGLRVGPEALGRPVGYGVFTGFPEGRLFVQKNWYFFHRTERFTPRLHSDIAYEQKFGFDWLPVDRCGSSDGMVRPGLLVDLVKRLRDGDIPPEPVSIGGSFSPRFVD